jgi:hypothetical protein
MSIENQDHRLRLYLSQEARTSLDRLKEANSMSASQVITTILLKMADLGMENLNELQQASK